MGNISRCVLVKNISNLIHFIDPLTGQTASMSAEVFWRNPFRPIVTAGRSRLTRYVVLGKEAVALERNASKRRATSRQKSRVALVTIAKEDDLGLNDEQIVQTSTLGYLFKAGDVGVGYDLKDIQIVDEEAEEAREAGKLPDAVIVRKLYGGAAASDANASKQRIWALQKLEVDVVETSKSKQAKKEKELDDMDEEDFMQEVEADKEMRSNMFLYKTEVAKKKMETKEDATMNEDEDDEDDEDEDDQKVKLDELLDGLVLNEGPGQMNEEDQSEWGSHELLVEGERANRDGISYFGKDEARKIDNKDVAMPAGSTFGKEFFAKDFKFT